MDAVDNHGTVEVRLWNISYSIHLYESDGIVEDELDDVVALVVTHDLDDLLLFLEVMH